MTQIIEVLFPLAVVTSNHLLPIRSMIFLAVKLLADVSLVLFYTAIHEYKCHFIHHANDWFFTFYVVLDYICDGDEKNIECLKWQEGSLL